ncbi:hypothetical protein G3A43_07190 [Paraburkholderia aspalathi]|nr:hypothetical protein [Paraburkholderia aspalathi]MBK3780037.1 hypothetical protein [Paraburkholderia aspalathi]
MTHKTKTAGVAGNTPLTATAGAGALAKVEPAKEVTHVEVKKEIEEHFDHLAVGLFHLLAVAVNFIAVGAVAVGLGYCLDWAHVHCNWMSEWMFDVGHVVEGVIYVADCINLVVGVAKMLKKTFKDF